MRDWPIRGCLHWPVLHYFSGGSDNDLRDDGYGASPGPCVDGDDSPYILNDLLYISYQKLHKLYINNTLS